MRFQVPQFIEMEDKIFGPLTLKQFIYLAGGAGLAFIVYKVIPIFFLAVPFMLIVVVFALALAFYKVNNKSFIVILEAAVRYTVSTKLYIWKKVDRKVTPTVAKKEEASVYIPRLSDSKLKDLSWSLDINEAATPGAEEMYKTYKKSRV